MRQDRIERSRLREEDFRSLLDEHGILRRGACEPPARSAAFTVFAQRSDARVEAEIWRRHAAQFFDTRLDLTVPKHYAFDPPDTDMARVVVSTSDNPEVIRDCHGRPRTEDDLHAAGQAEARVGAAGLGKLAQRCNTVWLVVAEGDPDGSALLVAAILASVVLGPILSPDGNELFGVRTARLKLEKSDPPYR
jgi:hypothetical protein